MVSRDEEATLRAIIYHALQQAVIVQYGNSGVRIFNNVFVEKVLTDAVYSHLDGHNMFNNQDKWIQEPDSIKCPQCQRTSYNPNDIKQKYCGACHLFHGDMIRE